MMKIKRRRAQIEGSNNSIVNQVQDIIILLQNEGELFYFKEATDQKVALILISILTLIWLMQSCWFNDFHSRGGTGYEIVTGETSDITLYVNIG